jgi:nucleoside-triphosphatase
MGHTLLLTGRPGVGKTTVVKQVAAALGQRAGGFYTEEIRGPGGRKGFRLVTLDGHAAIMAHVDVRSRHRVGRYGVDVATLDSVGVAAIRMATESDDTTAVVVDEVGKMELFSSEFRGAVIKAVSSRKIVVATVMQKENIWASALKAMPQVTVWEITEANRDQMPERVIQWISVSGT